VLAQVTTFALDGLHARRVACEVDIRPGLPAFSIVGLGDTAVREARERVRAAILNSGFDFPMRRITASLAPADLPKAGPGFDLPLAVGVLAASGQLAAARLDPWAVFGELSLGGQLRGARGTLVVAEAVRAHGIAGFLLARERGAEAALVDDVEVAAVDSLRVAVEVLGGAGAPPVPAAPVPSAPPPEPDLADVRGQAQAIAALRIAAAGGHNLLLEGAPGTGKTMLARRLPTILPPLAPAEAREVTRIQSLAGLFGGGGLVTRRPFRSPHHATSAAALAGGGAIPSPGEVTLAHRGVLFLDELAEFPRPTLEALRQPLEDGVVTVVRAQRAVRFPARVTLVAATNPCPCGHAGSQRECCCTEADQARYRRRLSGPLLDRIDLAVAVQRPTPDELAAPPVTTSRAVREEACAARERQSARLGDRGATCNAELDDAALAATIRLAGDADRVLARAYARGALSARGHRRVLRVARTLADLDGRVRVGAEDVRRALQFRADAAGARAA
jgi:magnesium chelatase family protein